MRVLALDTSSWWGSVALVEGTLEAAETVAELGIQVRGSHSNKLLRWFELLLAEAGWERSTIDVYAAIRGPGSFTGVRIGLGTVLGLGLATGRACAGISSLDALVVAHGPAEARRLPLIAAGRGEMYGAAYRAADFPPTALEAPWVGPPARALEALGSQPAVLFGSGTALLPGFDRERSPAVRIAEAPRTLAAAAGRLALAAPATAASGLAPLYVRPPDAWSRPRR